MGLEFVGGLLVGFGGMMAVCRMLKLYLKVSWVISLSLLYCLIIFGMGLAIWIIF